MTPLNDANTTQETRYETPTFDPRSAFARTLRGGEMARSGHLQPNSFEQPKSVEPRPARQVSGTPRRYETPTFNPSGAFARTLRGGEMARLERQRQLVEPGQLDVLVCAA